MFYQNNVFILSDLETEEHESETEQNLDTTEISVKRSKVISMTTGPTEEYRAVEKFVRDSWENTKVSHTYVYLKLEF